MKHTDPELLNMFAGGVRSITDALGDGMSLRQIEMLLAVAKAGGEVKQVDIQKELKLNSATATRNFQVLGDGSARTKGLGLVKTKVDWSDQRFKLVEITPKGQRLIASTVTGMRTAGGLV